MYPQFFFISKCSLYVALNFLHFRNYLKKNFHLHFNLPSLNQMIPITLIKNTLHGPQKVPISSMKLPIHCILCFHHIPFMLISIIIAHWEQDVNTLIESVKSRRFIFSILLFILIFYLSKLKK